MTSTKTLTRLLMAAALALPIAALPVAQAHAAIVISVGFAPPVLPVYSQPYCPGPGYIWTPGYWAYGPDGYYWVPGVWVLPPDEGLLWTPAWWGWEGNAYIFHPGYWGPQVGFYGGINYGFGYNGVGFVGGEWRGRTFYYNRAVANVGGNFHNVYSRPVSVRSRSTVSFNGGRGGISARPTAQEQSAMNQHHSQPTANQTNHQNFAAQNRGQRATVNNGRPGVPAAATVNSFRNSPTNATQAARPSTPSRPNNQSFPGNRGSQPAYTPQQPANQPTQNRTMPQPQAHPQTQPRPQAQPRTDTGHPAPAPRAGDEHHDDRR